MMGGSNSANVSFVRISLFTLAILSCAGKIGQVSGQGFYGSEILTTLLPF
jgi:hypothetical protein